MTDWVYIKPKAMALTDSLRCRDTASERCIGKCKYIMHDAPGWEQMPDMYFCNIHQMMMDAADKIDEMEARGTENERHEGTY